MPSYQSIINSVKGAPDCFNRRQELIKEIERLTGRRLLVYVADTNKRNGTLGPDDKTGFSDLIQDIEDENVDIMINSPGGFAEVTEIIVGELIAFLYARSFPKNEWRDRVNEAFEGMENL